MAVSNSPVDRIELFHSPYTKARVIDFDDIVHELDINYMSDPIDRSIVIPPSKQPTIARIRSVIDPKSARGFNSPQYMATIRRRTSQQIANALKAAAKQIDRDDFDMVIYPIVESIRNLISLLLEVDSEGNTRETLRQLRDSMIDGRWEKYKDSRVREVSLQVLEVLANNEEVSGRDAFKSAELLEDAGCVVCEAIPFHVE